MKRLLSTGVCSLIFAVSALPAFAQTPNMGSILVTVVDQNDAIVRGANVTVVNIATGATREAVSDDQGTATIGGLPLTGTYKVTVTMTGFTVQDVRQSEDSVHHHDLAYVSRKGLCGPTDARSAGSLRSASSLRLKSGKLLRE